MAIPLVRKSGGRRFGDHAVDVQIEVFLDAQCPYSAKAWPTIEQVLAHYGPQNVGLSVYMMVLSKHRQSWDVTLGLYGLAGNDAERFFGFLSYLYSQQERYFNGAFTQRTHEDLKQLVVELGYEFGEVTRERMTQLLASDDVYAAAKHPGRIAAIRGVWGTPTVFINQSERGEIGSASTLADWRGVIDPLLAGRQ